MEEMTGQKHPLSFPKRERLHHRTAVELLFSRGESVYAYPLRMFYLILPGEELTPALHPDTLSDVGRLQMMVTIPKKKFKRAVKRVLMRRRVKEAYRLDRLPLRDMVEHDPQGRYMLLAFIYAGDKLADSSKIRRQMGKLLAKAQAAFAPVKLNEDEGR